MRFFLQILFLLLTWFTNLVNATPVFTKVVLPNYDFAFSKTVNVNEEIIVKIGVLNFARSGILEDSFFQKGTSTESYAVFGASSAGECKTLNGAGSAKLWTSIDEFDGLFNGNYVTYYDVNVTYQTFRVRAGIAFPQNDVLNFDINLPANLQEQGIGTAIFMRAIDDYSPTQVQGLWKTSENYLGGESINLSIFKQNKANGMTDIEAAFATPTGKILKANGFGGVPMIVINTGDEVKIIFNRL
jgi:hypothetical protein